MQWLDDVNAFIPLCFEVFHERCTFDVFVLLFCVVFAGCWPLCSFVVSAGCVNYKIVYHEIDLCIIVKLKTKFATLLLI